MFRKTYNEIPGVSDIVWFDDETNRYIHKHPDHPGKFVISADPRIVREVTGDLTTTLRSIPDGVQNGAAVCTDGTWFLQVTDLSSRILAKGVGVMMDSFVIDEETHGDGWYSGLNSEEAMIGKGTYADPLKRINVAKVVIEGWVKDEASGDNVSGTYSAIPGSSVSPETLTVGWRVLESDLGGALFQQKNQKREGELVFKTASANFAVWFDGSDWIISPGIGMKDSATGYWTGGEPPASGDAAVVYTLVANEGVEGLQSAVALSYKEHTLGFETIEILTGQVAVWR